MCVFYSLNELAAEVRAVDAHLQALTDELTFYREHSNEWTKFDDCEDHFDATVSAFLSKSRATFLSLDSQHERMRVEVSSHLVSHIFKRILSVRQLRAGVWPVLFRANNNVCNQRRAGNGYTFFWRYSTPSTTATSRHCTARSDRQLRASATSCKSTTALR